MQPRQTLAAAALALAASAILSFIDNFVLAISKEAGLWQFQVFRTLTALPLLVVAARLTGQTIRPVNLPRLAGRSIAVSVGLLIYFASLGALPVSQAGAGLFSAPLWVALFSIVIFRQRIGGVGIFAVFIGFAGALMLLQPDPQNLTALSLMPLSAGLFYGLGMMLTRHWCAEESAVALALGIFLCIGLAGVVMLFIVAHWPGDSFITAPWTLPTSRFLWLVAFQAIGAVLAVTLIAQAYRIGNPAVVAVFEYSFLIFASLWAFLLWGTPTNALAWAGIAMIIASGILMVSSHSKTSDAAASA